jgi:hypothetical protein
VNKELDTHSPMDCEPGVKRKMADCRLCLEAASFEAEKVVTRLLRDHEAWGRYHVKVGQRRRRQIPEWSLKAEGKPTTPPQMLS